MLITNIFKDKDGRIVITQRPNLPILSWIFFTITANLLPDGQLQAAAEIMALGSVFTWAWLELFQGVNTFRRILGATILLGVVFSRVA